MSRRVAWACWLAVLAAAAAATALLLDLRMQPGPWLALALSASVAGLLAALVAAIGARAARRELEAADARAAIAESERQVGEREVRRLSTLEGELTRAKQAAESAVLAKGEFLATMSHEIRTPLNGIVPMLDLLARSPMASDQRQMLQTAATSSQQLLRIVDDILDYSKLEANKLELELAPFNLREVLDAVMQLMQRPAESRGLHLSLQLDPAVRLLVRGDPLRLRQVLTNLIGNAIKFTNRGSVTVVVRRLGETAAQHLLRFEVRDTGIGIDQDTQDKLFHSFSQADASTTRVFGGTGLGLAICKRIIDLMGGRISVVSERGRGSTFWFEIPLAKALGDLRTGETGSEPQRVLLVSADPRLRQRLAGLLAGLNIPAQVVETAQDALERLRAPGPGYSSVVADLASMPGSARALHRAVTRMEKGRTRLVWLYGDEPVSEELREDAGMVPRQVHEADLRAMLADPGPAQTVQAPPPALIQAPLLPEEPATAPPAPHQPGTAGAGLQPATTPRVLVVEDNPVNLAVAERMLASLGLDSDHAENGAIALDMMSRARYPLVLMDCQMPLLDGYTATRRWRAREAESEDHLPIVAMTANAMAGDRQRCLDAGMDDYLSKPISREGLEAVVKRWMTPVAAPAPAAPATAPVPAAQPAPLSPPAPVQASPPASPVPVRAAAGPAASSTSAAAQAAAAAAAAVPSLDLAVLEELREVTGAGLRGIIALFLEDAPRLIGQLEAASAQPDLDAMAMAAHSLKSSSANLGAMALSAAARRIELGAREHALERPAIAVALVIAEFARARMGLQGYLARLGPEAA